MAEASRLEREGSQFESEEGHQAEVRQLVERRDLKFRG